MGDGTPIGSYYSIEGFKNCYQIVILKSLSGKETAYIKRDRIKVMQITKNIISHGIFTRIEAGRQINIIHDLTPSWSKIYYKKPSLIQLRDELYENKMLFEIDEIKIIQFESALARKDSRSRQIRVSLGTRII